MIRTAALALISACALAACNPSANSGGDSASQAAANAAASVFPDLFQTAYRAEAVITDADSGETTPVVMIRDGRKLRMEVTSEQGPVTIVTDGATGDSFMVMRMNGQQMVLRQNLGDMPTAPEEMWGGQAAGTATVVGPCTHAGQTGQEWRSDEEDNRACVTSDGIILWGSSNGQRTWETTSVQRGPQDPALFQPPAGAQVMDMGNMGAAMADALARAKAGN